MHIRNQASVSPFGARSFFGPSARLFAPDDAGDPGGAGGGAGGGAADTLTPAQLKAIGEVVNSAVTNHLKRDLGKAIQGALTPALDSLKAELIKATAKPEGDKGNGGSGDNGGKGDDAAAKKGDPETEKLRTQVQQLLDRQRTVEEKAAEQTKKAQNDRALSKLTTYLSEKCASPAIARMVAENMLFVQNKIVFDDAGEPQFRHEREVYKGGPREPVELPLEDGLAAWVGTKEAENYLKAPGGGTRQSSSNNGGGFTGNRRFSHNLQPSDPGWLEAEKASMEAALGAEGANR